MYLKNVYIRFYKSFNYDYLRKFDPHSPKKDPWEMIDGMWYPYVRIPIDPKITTVVGENESGKTHLLSAIKKGITGQGIEREDFCRYSQFFAVEQGKMKWPNFGFEWADLNREDRQQILSAAGIDKPGNFDRFYLFRTQPDELTLYLSQSGSPTVLKGPAAEAVRKLLPNVFKLEESVALPANVPIRWLAKGTANEAGLEALARQQRVGLLEKILANKAWFADRQSVTQAAGEIASAVASFTGQNVSSDGTARRQAELNLARDLILKVAKIDPEAIQELFDALGNGHDAFANSIIDKINDSLDASLNFPHWWVQDKAFRLQVSAREYDLVFTIRDRTGTEYSFTERSSGLRYFLSYFIQYLAHEPATGGQEILVMDEPDAFLSSQGQQDLLKIFDAFASPESGRTPIQVVYVTHSPFLIDKNHSERIRVLQKGVGDEGTRVVRDASRNHYEPLRSAFGAFVGETAFIGNCNLITEGPADQILLAGASMYLRSKGASDLETLDLNRITIVPASGAPHVPHLVYLARGRDVEKPAVIVLLDSDDAGKQARKDILRGGPRRKQILAQKYILQIHELCKEHGGVRTATGRAALETEDLIPLPICVEAVKNYLDEVSGADSDVVANVTAEAVQAKMAEGVSVFQAVETYLAAIPSAPHMEKIGFARAVNAIVNAISGTVNAASAGSNGDSDVLRASLAQYETNMKTLFRQLCQMQRQAVRELASERVSQRLDRIRQSFLQDHPDAAKREHAIVLFEEIEAGLDDSSESDAVQLAMQGMRRDFQIDTDPTAAIDDFPGFVQRLQGLQYAARLDTQEADKPSPGNGQAVATKLALASAPVGASLEPTSDPQVVQPQTTEQQASN